MLKSSFHIDEACGRIMHLKKCLSILHSAEALLLPFIGFCGHCTSFTFPEAEKFVAGKLECHLVLRFFPTTDSLLLFLQEERSKTKGPGWFGLPAPEMTDELKHDLEVLRMRHVLDPKRFYKKNDLKDLPKYFQVCKDFGALSCLWLCSILGYTITAS